MKLTTRERNRRTLVGAIRRRLELVRRIARPGVNGGFVCDDCKAEFPDDGLEIDHVDGRTWQPRELSPQMRSARYWREFLAGVRLRALCRSCNARDGGHRRWRKR